MGKYAYLICVQAKNKETGEDINNNKFYEMKENDDGTFLATYGRIGSGVQTKEYGINEWDRIYNNKTNKVRNGYIYKDVTDLRTTGGTSTFEDVKEKEIQKLLNSLQQYSNTSISTNYTISSESVTQLQVEEAQSLIDCASKIIISKGRSKKNSIDFEEINDKLIELYQVIPRAMKKVQDYLIPLDDYKESLQKAKEILDEEQKILDVMTQQVSLNTQDTTETQTLADALGVKIEKISNTDKEEILELMGDDDYRFRNAFRVVHHFSNDKFEEYKKNKAFKHWTKLLWHGSRNENWLNILKTSLLIRPAGVVLTGAMFGNGIYFADKCRKSIGYTSLDGSYWAGGSSNKAYIALFAVNTGFELQKQKHEYWMYDLDEKMLKDKGDYDSLFAKGGIDLYNNEYIVYNPAQCTIKYLVEIGG